MSVFDPSMEPMVEMFIYETTTLLEQLDEILLNSEKSHSMTEDDVNQIFRVMHTIKSSSAMMGLGSISNLSHRMEDMFFIIRADPGKMHERNSGSIFDLLFQASDFLKSEVERIQQDGDYEPADATSLTDSIQHEVLKMRGELPDDAPVQVMSAQPETPVEEAIFEETDAESIEADATAPLDETEESTPSAGASNEKFHHIRVFFEDECQMENIRAFMLLSQLKDCCDEIETEPAHPESDASCCAEIIKNGFLMHLKPIANIQDVYAVIESAINIKSYIEEGAQPTATPSSSSDNGEAGPPAEHPSSVSDGSAAPAAANDAPPSASAEAGAAAAGSATRLGKQSLISVNQIKLDQLMDIMGEIVIAESMVASNPELKGLPLDNFHKSARQLRKLTDQLQDIVMSIRMVPLVGTFQKMNRIVRDMNKKLGKDVELVTIGGDTEVDKTINDVLGDPFMHMIRNSMDHAIESPEERLAQGKSASGTVTIQAQSLGSEIVITVSDDGRGLNKDAILKKARKNGLLTKPETDYTEKEIFGMIMLPGFSTNEVVTEYSGRGVGMDVVRKNLEDVNGTLSVESKVGVGTTFTIKIPLTLAIVDGMVVTVGRDTFTIPITSIKQTFKLSDEIRLFHDTEGNEMIMMRGECFPVIRLHSVYNIETEMTNLDDGIFILVENDKKSACLFVDVLVGEQQVVVKPFPSFLNRYDIKGSGLAGCTIMGDGSISLILDINNFLNRF